MLSPVARGQLEEADRESQAHLQHYRKYRALLAKERRRRVVAETKANRNARKASKLERRLAKILNEIAASEPVDSDPYLKIEMED